MNNKKRLNTEIKHVDDRDQQSLCSTTQLQCTSIKIIFMDQKYEPINSGFHLVNCNMHCLRGLSLCECFASESTIPSFSVSTNNHKNKLFPNCNSREWGRE